MLHSSSARRARPAFTLIELLVVIAIIAILAAILFPVFAQARAQARKTTCLSNVKQASLAVLMYVQDYDETFPLLYAPQFNSPPDGIGFTYSWHNLVQPYTKNWAMMICPDNFLNHGDPINYLDPFLNYGIPARAATLGVASFADTYYTQGATALLDGIGGAFPDNGFSAPTPGAPSDAIAAIASPASMTLITDASAPDWWLTQFGITTDVFWYCVTWFSSYQQQRFGPIPRHLQQNKTVCSALRFSGGQTIVAFTDGHTKSIPISQYFGTKKNSAGQLVYQYLWPSE